MVSPLSFPKGLGHARTLATMDYRRIRVRLGLVFFFLSFGQW
jgi:hypothetical protein